MNIGMMMAQTNTNFSLQLLDAFAKAANERSVQLFIFEGRALNSPYYQDLSYNHIYNLISSKTVDALVVDVPGIASKTDKDSFRVFLESAGVPVVCIGDSVEGFPSVLPNDEDAMNMMVSHLVDSGYSKLVHVSGATDHPCSIKRRNAFELALLKYKMPNSVHRNWISGDFSILGGYKAMENLEPTVRSGEIDAILFANDDMAIGALEYCEEHGIQVPADLCITGMDNNALGANTSPALTSISFQEDKMAAAALDILLGVSSNIKYHPELVVRDSCCCTPGIIIRNNRLVATRRHAGKIGEFVQTFASEELTGQLTAYMKQIAIRFCFLVLYDGMVTDNEHQAPTWSSVLHGFANGRQQIHDDLFQTEEILPAPLMKFVGNNPLIIKPLFFRHEIFGYMVASSEEKGMAFIEEIRTVVSITLKGEQLLHERAQTKKRLEWALDAMRAVNNRLSDISLRDELTGLFNRRGFQQDAIRYIQTCTDEFLLFYFDMNGLKQINDKYGHDDGDLSITTMAEILKRTFRDQDIIARIGGDEFVAIAKGATVAQVKSIIDRSEVRRTAANDKLNKPYDVSFAWGYVSGDHASNFDDILQLADAEMYKHKMANRAVKNTDA